ncbi:unnamed protein product [Lymnaea stagnalis]|uniref:SCP domain-containing protein n=1 Tax=Lymnaea stagnalis TaxID=6523 RepID=A0AAV2IH83_LYMST
MLTLVLHILAMFVSSYAAVPERLSRSDLSAFLYGHNQLRLSLGLEDLIWNTTLATFAENHGSRCVWRHSRSKYGENLYASSPRKTDNEEIARHAIELWAAEVENVDPEWACIFVSEGTCGHYSQLVWRNTKEVGCAVVHCSGFLANYVVCEYWPPGNFYKQIPY